MATQLFKITNGPSKLDLMLALFDPYPNGDARMLKFTAESHGHRALEAMRAGRHDSRLSREDEAEVEIYDLNMDPFDFELFIVGVKRLHDGDEWVINGQILDNNYWNPTDVGPIEIRFSTKSRKGSCEMDPMDYPDPEAEGERDIDYAFHNIDELRQWRSGDSSMSWTCNWCKQSFNEDVAHPKPTSDGETICYKCFDLDNQGPQIARDGINAYEAENEPERVVDADGKVDYE